MSAKCQKRTFSNAVSMSAGCQKRKSDELPRHCLSDPTNEISTEVNQHSCSIPCPSTPTLGPVAGNAPRFHQDRSTIIGHLIL